MVGMGFRPFIRFTTPPQWATPHVANSTHEVRQITMIKSEPLRAVFLRVVHGVVEHLFDRYGAQTRSWAFSCLNEIGLYTPLLSNGNWDVGSQYLAVMFSEFASTVRSVDGGLRAAGGIESTNSYEFAFYALYLNRTNQTSLLANASFLDHHHYGDYGNLTADLDATLDHAKVREFVCSVGTPSTWDDTLYQAKCQRAASSRPSAHPPLLLSSVFSDRCQA
jgi:hypothetical protein